MLSKWPAFNEYVYSRNFLYVHDYGMKVCVQLYIALLYKVHSLYGHHHYGRCLDKWKYVVEFVLMNILEEWFFKRKSRKCFQFESSLSKNKSFLHSCILFYTKFVLKFCTTLNNLYFGTIFQNLKIHSQD